MWDHLSSHTEVPRPKMSYARNNIMAKLVIHTPENIKMQWEHEINYSMLFKIWKRNWCLLEVELKKFSQKFNTNKKVNLRPRQLMLKSMQKRYKQTKISQTTLKDIESKVKRTKCVCKDWWGECKSYKFSSLRFVMYSTVCTHLRFV